MPIRLAASRLMRAPARLRVGLSYVAPGLGHLARWLLTSREETNFTYDLSPLNLQHLAAAVALVTDCPARLAESYIREAAEDLALRNHVRDRVASSPRRLSADVECRLGRRLGWYATTRVLRPRLVVETGVDKGLGALVICAALLRNAAEGSHGRYVGTDINPEAGYLLTGLYSRYGHIQYGDSVTTLRAIEGVVDLFISDSDHSAAYESEEYRTIHPKLSPASIILGDNAHCTDSLIRFSEETGRAFLFFREEPLRHWYPGGGIGFSWYPRQNRRP